MKIAILNSVCGSGSTGKICMGISKMLSGNGVDNRIFYFYGNSDYPLAKKCSLGLYIKLQALKSRLFGTYGFNSVLSTYYLIYQLKKFSPDVVHVHNIHGHDVNLSILIKWLKKHHIKIVWTLHDCWMFTGYCTYFSLCGCSKWETGCENCPQRKKYSWFFDRSESNYNKKKNLLQNGITFVTPSAWLRDIAKKSFLKNSEIEVAYNGIDTRVFRQYEDQEAHAKKTVLGVAFGWNERKGLDTFIELSKRLDDRFEILLVGTDEEVEKILPERIKTIRRTNSQEELARIYSCCDVMVNPTKEEVFGMVNAEALACGTPVITYRTGGAPESVNEKSGMVVEYGDIDGLTKAIKHVCVNQPFKKEDCIERGQFFEENKRYLDYWKIYESILTEKAGANN